MGKLIFPLFCLLIVTSTACALDCTQIPASEIYDSNTVNIPKKDGSLQTLPGNFNCVYNVSTPTPTSSHGLYAIVTVTNGLKGVNDYILVTKITGSQQKIVSAGNEVETYKVIPGSQLSVQVLTKSVVMNSQFAISVQYHSAKMTNPTKPNKEVYVGIADNSNSFCISPLEMYNFLEIPTAGVDQIYADSYCKNDTICTKLSKNCNWILGDVKITTNSDLENMKSVEAIFGGITISGTNITDFSFLENLKYVAQLEHKPAKIWTAIMTILFKTKARNLVIEMELEHFS
ncbi:unnamed protein product [Caenorhabditis nigoni]